MHDVDQMLHPRPSETRLITCTAPVPSTCRCSISRPHNSPQHGGYTRQAPAHGEVCAAAGGCKGKPLVVQCQRGAEAHAQEQGASCTAVSCQLASWCKFRGSVGLRSWTLGTASSSRNTSSLGASVDRLHWKTVSVPAVLPPQRGPLTARALPVRRAGHCGAACGSSTAAGRRCWGPRGV